MVPNAWLTRKWGFIRHLKPYNYIWHAHHEYARVIHCCKMWLKYYQSKFLFLGLWGWTKLMLLRKGSSSQVKVWIELHRSFVYCQTHLGLLMSLLLPVLLWQRCHGPCWKSKLIQPYVLRKNSQYFNCASFAYIHAFHWLHCSLHSFLENRTVIIVIKWKNALYDTLTECMLELE